MHTYTIRPLSGFLKPWLLVLFLLALGTGPASAQSNDPATAPMPDFLADIQDPARAMVVELLFRGPTDVELISAGWARTRARTNIANPPHYEVELYGEDAALIERFDIWNPLWNFTETEDGGESLQIESEAKASVVFPLSGDLSELRLFDVESGRQLITVDLTPALADFCAANPGHPECDGVEPANRAPAANDDLFSTREDMPADLDVAANDEDPDGNLDLTSLTVQSGPFSGDLVNSGGGIFTYSPEADYAGEDAFSYQVCDSGADFDPATDGDDLCDTADVTIRVDPVNDPPHVQAGEDRTVDEGDGVEILAAFTDSDSGDTQAAKVDWGDSIMDIVTPAGEEVSAGHIYADDGIYTVTVTVIDSATAAGSDSITVTVENAPPSLEAGPDQSATAGDPVSVAATFKDAGTLDTHTASIDWGDGSAPGDGTVEETPSGPPGDAAGMTGTVSGSHVFPSTGTFTVTVSVTDDEGASDADALTLSVDSGDSLRGDLDGDGRVCRTDLDLLMTHRNRLADVCPECDLDADGMITVLDARKLVLLCTAPRCGCE